MQVRLPPAVQSSTDLWGMNSSRPSTEGVCRIKRIRQAIPHFTCAYMGHYARRLSGRVARRAAGGVLNRVYLLPRSTLEDDMTMTPYQEARELIDREYRPPHTRLSIQGTHRRSTFVSDVREFLVAGLCTFALLTALYVSIGGVIGFVRGAYHSAADLVTVFLRLAGM